MRFKPTTSSLFYIIIDKETIYGKREFNRSILTIFIISIIIFFSTIFFYNYISYSDKFIEIKGIDRIEHDGSYYMIASIPKISTDTYFSSIYLHLHSNNYQENQEYSIEAIFNCYLNNNKSLIIQQNIPSLYFGKSELLNTGIPNYNIMIVQLFMKGNFKNNISISLIQTFISKEFQILLNKIKIILLISLLIILIFYFLNFLIFKKFKEITQYLSLFSLIFTLISIYFFGKNNNITNHSIDLLFRGFISSFNLITLFGLSYTYISGDNLSATLIISTLFLICDAFRSLTTDTFILSQYFDNNGVIWVFFFSTSIVSKISIILIIFHHLIYAYLYGPLKSRIKIILLSIISFIYIIPKVLRLLYLATKENESSSINFFCDFFLQYIISCLISLFEWPTIDYDVDTTTSISQYSIKDDNTFIGLFGDANNTSDSD